MEEMKKYHTFLKDVQQRTAQRHSSTEPLRSVKDNWSKRTVEGNQDVDVKEPYLALLAVLEAKEEYEPLSLDSFQPEERYSRQHWLEKLKLSFPVDLYAYHHGNYMGNVNFIWKLPQELNKRSDDALIKAFTKVREVAKVYGTRQMVKELMEPYRKVNPIKPSLLRHMIEFMHPNMSVPTECEAQFKVNERVAVFLLEADDPDLVMDLRANNGRIKDGRFDPFWEELDSYLTEQSAVHERRQSNLYLPFAISVRDLTEIIKSRLPDGTPVPSESLIRLQFWPSNPYTSTAVKYSGRYQVKYAVQQRLLRVQHEDSRYCANQFGNLKTFAVHMKDFTVFLSDDDKAIIPVGNPGSPLSATQRHHNRSLSATSGAAPASDHDFHTCGMVPSVIFNIDIPEAARDSFYQGEPNVVLKDKIFQPSSALRHATETVKVLRGDAEQLEKPILILYTDGGPDHRTTFQSVQIAHIATSVKLNLDMLVAARTAPHQSYTNPAERIMADLNLALQNTAIAREEMPPAFEMKMKSLTTISAVRNATDNDPQLKDHLLEACKPASDAIKGRFQRLVRKEQPFKVWDPATAEDMQEMVDCLAEVFEEELTIEDVIKSVKIAKWPKLQAWVDHHCRFGHYMLQVWCPF